MVMPMLADWSLGTTVPAKDLDRTRRFYEDVLGAQVVTEDPGGIIYRSGDSYFSLYPTEYAGTAQHTLGAFMVGDVEAAVAALRGKGVSCLPIPKPSVHHGPGMQLRRPPGRKGVDPRGRSCPLAYRYQPEALAGPAQLEADTLYVVGGLYGNPAALAAVLERAHQEPGGPATIVFNGDFHWLDADPDDFCTISETVLAHHATKGNVEAELAAEDETAGCGCAYPDYIDDDVVERSNQVITRLRATAGQFPELVGCLGELPRYLTASVGGERVGILHGDPESLAGWRLALEAMEPGDPAVRRQVGWRGRPTTADELLDWFGRADVDVFASTHTGLPYAQVVPDGRRRRLVINNGAAGLPNFADTTYGVITRLSGDPRPPADGLYGTGVGTLRCDALPVLFDDAAWMARFVAQWPPGSPGHRAYFGRITTGTHLRLEQAARAGVELGSHSH